MTREKKKTKVTFRTRVRSLMEDFLSENKIPYFIGGSERFGWTRIDSDIDIFAFCQSDSTDNDNGVYLLEHLLAINGIPYQPTPNKPLYPQNSTQLTVLSLIHLNIFTDKIAYDVLKTDHDNLEKEIAKDKRLITLALELKKYGLKGSIIYKSLQKTIRK
jgi:hypothetical protein